MTSTVESDIVEINEGMADAAKLMASSLSTPKARKRALIDMMGINCAISYLQSKRLKIDTQKSIYKIPKLYEEYKISDIYYRNYRIDVITLYKEKNIKIPKIHADMDILADFYFVVQVGAKIKEVKIGQGETTKTDKEDEENSISNTDISKIKAFLIDEYEVSEECLEIN